ncbi:MAG: TIGR04282 family arsenosugar biosynthesis glycosyltransferase [Burkholderiales bacterium]
MTELPPTSPSTTACAVGVFARAPVPGQTKTRLIPALGARGAAELATHMLRHALRVAQQAQLGPVTLWAAGDAQHPLLLQLAQEAGVAVRAQVEGDLGERMHHALAAMQSASCPHAMVLGSDVPALQTRHLQSAARALETNDVAVLPAQDGGYVLIARRQPFLAPFQEVNWGSDQVLQQTRTRCQDAGLMLWEGEVLWDVDRREDLERLKQEIPGWW